MKNIAIFAFLFLLTFSLFYLVGAFVQVSFDISKWTETSRGCVGVFGFLFSVIVPISYIEINESNKK